jgi:type IV pilus assembly protein PilA
MTPLGTWLALAIRNGEFVPRNFVPTKCYKVSGVQLNMKAPQNGFTLIELMIVVAIIGILAAIAIPAYQDYTVRAQVTEGMNLAGAVETGIADYFANTGSFPTALSSVGISSAPTGKYVSNLTITGGAIVVTYGLQANSNVATQNLTLTPYTDGSQDIIWVCGAHTPPTGATLPTGVVSGVTTVADKYLPQTCRAAG